MGISKGEEGDVRGVEAGSWKAVELAGMVEGRG